MLLSLEVNKHLQWIATQAAPSGDEERVFTSWVLGKDSHKKTKRFVLIDVRGLARVLVCWRVLVVVVSAESRSLSVMEGISSEKVRRW